MHYQFILLSILHHASEFDITRLRCLLNQHMVIRTNTICIFRHLFHGTRLKHPVVVVINPASIRLFLLRFIPVGIGNQLYQIEIHTHFGFQHILNTLQLISIKTLQINFVVLTGVTIFLQHFQRFCRNILPFLMMEPRRFDFWINTDIFPGRVI